MGVFRLREIALTGIPITLLASSQMRDPAVKAPVPLKTLPKTMCRSENVGEKCGWDFVCLVGVVVIGLGSGAQQSHSPF